MHEKHYCRTFRRTLFHRCCCSLEWMGAPGGDAWERLGSNAARCARQKKQWEEQQRKKENGVKDERMRVQQVDLQLAAVLCLLTSQNARLHEKLAEAGRLSKLVLVTCAKVRHM